MDLKFIESLIEREKNALDLLKENLNEEYLKSISLLKQCRGKLIFGGIGKSGHIAKKISATFCSVGIPSLFLHLVEALHGDLGIISKEDVIILISNSGSSKEILPVINYCKNINVPIIAITGNLESTLAKNSKIVLNLGKQKEIDEYNLVPTSSSTATLVVGDVLAIALSKAKGFRKEDFAKCHPNGNLGKRLTLSINEIMHQGSKTPCLSILSSMEEVINEMSSKALGVVCIIDENSLLNGIITDGDLRRFLEKYKKDIFDLKLEDVMTKSPIVTYPDELAFSALDLMEKRKNQISVLPVIDRENKKLLGVVRLHDILQ